MARWAVVLVTFASLIAGCSGSSTPRHQDVIASAPTSEDAPLPDPVITGTGFGSLEGLVTDAAAVGVRGAIIELAGTDLSAVTAKNGTFAIHGIPQGEYAATASANGLSGATGIVLVEPDATARTWFRLAPLPPPPPYHETLFLNGTARYATTLFSLSCSPCIKDLEFGATTATVIVEVEVDGKLPAPDPPLPDPFGWGNSTVYVELRKEGASGAAWQSQGGSPFWDRVDAKYKGNYTFSMSLYSYPYVDDEIPFKAYITVFYGQPAPPNWSYMAGNR